MVRVRVSCFLASVAIGQTSAAPPASTLVSAPPRHALTNCTGSSAQLPAAQCAAWQAFYDGAGGEGWALTIPGSGNPPICPGTRNDPCACHGWVGNNPICNSAGTSVVKMCVSGPRHRYSPLLGIPSAHPHTPLAAAACACLLIPPRPPPPPPSSSWLTNSNLTGTIAAEVGAWVDLTDFRVNGNMLSGSVPASAARWTGLVDFQVEGNELSGGALPELDFAQMIYGNCGTKHWRTGLPAAPRIAKVPQLTPLLLRAQSSPTTPTAAPTPSRARGRRARRRCA